jgi:hypothetical protein
MLQAVDFWLGMGVDGLRLDAVPSLFSSGRGRTARTCPRPKFLSGIALGVGPSVPNGADLRLSDTDEQLHISEGILSSFPKELSIG